MDRKEALTKWLEKVTGDGLAKDLQNARSSGDHLDEILALLSGNKRLDACEKAQDKSDHYLAMLISLASGPNMTFGQLLQNQLERWQEARADKFIEEKRLKLYSLLSGNCIKFIYSEKATKFCEIFPLFCLQYIQTKGRGKFQTFLWPSLNI